jgi:hypothetical protein
MLNDRLARIASALGPSAPFRVQDMHNKLVAIM